MPMTFLLDAEPAPDCFADLEGAERLVVWAARYWVTCCKARRNPLPGLLEGFAGNGVATAAHSLDALFAIVATSAIRLIDVRCTACTRLSPDELQLLDMVAAAQQGDDAGARSGLLAWLPGTVADLALGPALGLAGLLQAEGFDLPRRRPAAAMHPGTAAEAAGCTLH